MGKGLGRAAEKGGTGKREFLRQILSFGKRGLDIAQEWPIC